MDRIRERGHEHGERQAPEHASALGARWLREGRERHEHLVVGRALDEVDDALLTSLGER